MLVLDFSVSTAFGLTVLVCEPSSGLHIKADQVLKHESGATATAWQWCNQDNEEQGVGVD